STPVRPRRSRTRSYAIPGTTRGVGRWDRSKSKRQSRSCAGQDHHRQVAQVPADDAVERTVRVGGPAAPEVLYGGPPSRDDILSGVGYYSQYVGAEAPPVVPPRRPAHSR